MTKKALLVINVQNGMFQEGNVVYKGETCLLTQARSTNTPIFYVQHNAPAGGPLEYGAFGWNIHSAITPQEEDIIIQKINY